MRHRFPPEIISHAVWLYFRFSLSFRDVEDLLAERGVNLPKPGREFRFGMMNELLSMAGTEIPPSMDISELETIVDQASAFLYYGYAQAACDLLENIATQFPFVRHLISTLQRA